MEITFNLFVLVVHSIILVTDQAASRVSILEKDLSIGGGIIVRVELEHNLQCFLF